MRFSLPWMRRALLLSAGLALVCLGWKVLRPGRAPESAQRDLPGATDLVSAPPVVPACCAQAPTAQSSPAAGEPAQPILPVGPAPSKWRQANLAALWPTTPAEPAFADFRAWVLARPDGELGEIDPEHLREGLRLAERRREALLDLIEQNPERALALAVPRSLRSHLPEAIRERLEEPVDARGDLWVSAWVPLPGQESRIPPRRLELRLADGRSFEAFTFGARASIPSRRNLPVHGIALDGKLALSDQPARRLEPLEAAEWKDKLGEQVCPTSGLPTTEGEGEVALDWDGSPPQFFCGPKHAEDLAYQASLREQELPVAGFGVEGSSVEDSLTAKTTYTEGQKRMLLLRVDFPDATGQVVSDATLTSLVNSLNTHWSAMSYGKTSWAAVGSGSTITPTLRLPNGHASYTGFGTLLAAARAAAEDAGYDYRDYHFDVVFTASKPSAGFAGVAYVGGRGAWIANSYWSLGVVTHEVGHNFGLNHAGFWDTTDGSVIGAGAAVEYGNPFDPMGGASSSSNAHFGARQKNYLDWLPDADVRKVTANGTTTTRVYAFDQTNATGARALAVDKSGTTNDYWVEVRQRYAASNKWMKDGVVLNWGNVSINNNKSVLLDNAPSSSTLDDCPVLLGRTFSDTDGGIHITPVAKGADANGVTWMDVTVNRGTYPANVPPSVALTATTVTPAVNANATFTTTAEDADGDVVSYYWDWGDSTFTANNAASATHAWSSSGTKTVRCLVSDMKGGVRTAQLLVQVGSATTFFIQGYVRDHRGDPIEGVLVKAGTSGSDTTDSEGYYAITGLAAGSRTLAATKTGLTLQADGFANPVVVGPSRQNINFLAPPGLPSIGSLGPIRVDQGSNSGALILPLADPDTPVSALTLAATSSDTNVVAAAGLVFATAPGGTRTLTITAPTQAAGSAEVTVTATDPEGGSATAVIPVVVNARPTLAGITTSMEENTTLTLDLATLATDDLDAPNALHYQVSQVVGGQTQLAADGHTVQFTPRPDYHGAASLVVEATDASLSSRTLLLWDFEAPDQIADGGVGDRSNFGRTGTLETAGNGAEYAYIADGPPALAPHGRQCLSLTGDAAGAARVRRTFTSDEVNWNDSDWSFAAWVNRADVSTVDVVMQLGTGTASTAAERLQLLFPAGTSVVKVVKANASGVLTELTGPVLAPGEWHHLALVYDRTAASVGSLSLYVDGHQRGVLTGVAMALSQSQPLCVGGAQDLTTGFADWFSGRLDDVLVHTGLFGKEEVHSLATRTALHTLGLASTTAATVSIVITGVDQPTMLVPTPDLGLAVGATSTPIVVRMLDPDTDPHALALTTTASNPILFPTGSLSLTTAPVAPAPWGSSNIGTVNAAGSMLEDFGHHLMAGSGAGIKGTSDEFRWLRQNVSGNAELQGRIGEMDFANEWAKAGFMLRDASTATAAFAFVGLTPGHGVEFLTRAAVGSHVVSHATLPGLRAPLWLKIRREGLLCQAFYADDQNGEPGDWQAVGAPIPVPFLNTTYRVGLAITSQADGTLCHAQFSRLGGTVRLADERVLTLKPAANQTGLADIDLTAGSATDQFLVAVGVNTDPTLSALGDLSVADGGGPVSFSFQVGDLHTPATGLVVTVTASNARLLPAGRILLSGTDSDRTVNLRPVPGEPGQSTITVSVSDGVATTVRSFLLDVPAGDPSILVRAGGWWRYNSASAHPSGWTLPGFDDSSWPEGPGQLGFGDGDEETLVPASPSRITTRFRRRFAVAPETDWSQLRLQLLRDDGLVVWLNGTEILRNNMPDGAITATTPAMSAVAGVEETTWRTLLASNPPLVPGENVLAVEMHQSSASSSDISFDLQIQAASHAIFNPAPRGEDWTYLDNGSDPGTTWNQATFVPGAAWKQGPGQLGYGDGDELTLIDGGPTTNRHPTAYFRRTFELADPAIIAHAAVRYLRDDGIALWLNGQELLRDNLPAGILTHTNLASAAAAGAAESQWFARSFPTQHLIKGINVIAAEVHQASRSSTDLSFDLELLLYPLDAIPPLQAAQDSTGLDLAWPGWGSGWMLQQSDNLLTWSTINLAPQTVDGRLAIRLPVGAVQRRYYRLVLP